MPTSLRNGNHSKTHSNSTLDWIDILQECTKTDGVCVEPTTKETEKSHQDTQKCKKMLLKKKSQTHKADAVHYESNQEPEHDDHI
jgi:hypothetical protein